MALVCELRCQLVSRAPSLGCEEVEAVVADLLVATTIVERGVTSAVKLATYPMTVVSVDDVVVVVEVVEDQGEII